MACPARYAFSRPARDLFEAMVYVGAARWAVMLIEAFQVTYQAKRLGCC
jgi:hypothetical protein